MKNVLYIGNALSHKGRTITTIETLGKKLKEICSVKVASNKSNKVLRLLDMIFLVLRNPFKTDFVLIDTYSTTNFYYALIISQICRFFKLNYIPILHGGNLEHRLQNNPKLSRLIFNNAYKLVAPSNFLKTVFEKYNYEVIYIPNFIELKDYPFTDRPIEIIKLLWVRSFSSIYNPNLAISVLKDLLAKNYEASLTMIGPEVDGSLSLAKDYAKQHNLDVNFTGKLSKKEWIQLSGRSNIFINTTNLDNTPVSLIEAMALGLPIVSTNVGGIPYLISDKVDGLLVPKAHLKAMVDQIIYLVENDTMRIKTIQNARRKAEHFDWDNVKIRWLSVLQ
ncbi:glycosyltransferase family 4 protein [uncultured Winogradskyella sp.]|uniref:glycosyltransferase family 4 protein n=1 Tax=uncultured Winogradskyella sp. TaxID=395353 RepID=UPI0026025EAA|nr:glycosyltransferase family 4 protein [uncultured Winogradskyella sp.]